MIINMSYDLVKPKNRTKVLQKLHIRKKSMQFIFFVMTFNIFFCIILSIFSLLS